MRALGFVAVTLVALGAMVLVWMIVTGGVNSML
jgi:hypothetical protein